jgi:hypothetical protein
VNRGLFQERQYPGLIRARSSQFRSLAPLPACPMPPRRLRSPIVPWKGSLTLPIGSHRPDVVTTVTYSGYQNPTQKISARADISPGRANTGTRRVPRKVSVVKLALVEVRAAHLHREALDGACRGVAQLCPSAFSSQSTGRLTPLAQLVPVIAQLCPSAFGSQSTGRHIPWHACARRFSSCSSGRRDLWSLS